MVKGRLLGLKGQPQEVRQALERAVRLDPANAEAHYRLGIWSFRQKRHAEAAAYFEKAVAVRPVDALAHDYLALCLEAIGESERAERAYSAKPTATVPNSRLPRPVRYAAPAEP